ncbi:UNVERIFIED_CONTAM: hypothetical protein PYX00_011051 [Menopon gallinae]|uniref:Glucose-6-phosphate isomerase n=1 Tax=Menopon gallinae TaxID=328185 RepID=A0AAW2H6N4_9NEOP
MVTNGFISQEEADSSYKIYWDNFDWSRANIGAFFLREDKAPYFSEYLREEIPQYLAGNSSIYHDGYTIYTTLNLEAQEYAQSLISETVRRANIVVQQNNKNESSSVDAQIVPVLDLMADLFNLNTMRVNGRHARKEAQRNFYERNIGELGLFASLFSQIDLEEAVAHYTTRHQKDTSGEVVEGALIALDHSSPSTLGYIVSMVGGEGFTANNQFNRAINGHVQAGSTFKPLFYAAALDKKKVNTATLLIDSPIAFQVDEYSELYTPNNFKGEWRGQVLLREALALSLNIPSIRVLQALGFDDAISYATRLLHVSDPQSIAREFPKALPLALGVSSLAPVQLAIAYSVFANEGRDIIPIAIRYIEDRNGAIIAQPEKLAWDKLNSMGSNAQILSPQASYLITHILQTSVISGYMRWPIQSVGGIDMALAGGSDLGPQAIYLALKGWAKTNRVQKLKAYFISNVDPDDAHELLDNIDLEQTLFILVSKSGTTQETLSNEQLIRQALQLKGLEASKHFISVTSKTSPLANNTQYLESFYIDDFIGGRYSSTSAVGLTMLALSLGKVAVEELLKGAHEADLMALEPRITDNPALLDALLGVYERNLLDMRATAVLPYSHALRRFPAHLQQLDMESNGKSVNRYSEEINYETGPLIFGEAGTNGQHSFYQFLHQGTDIIPLQFIGFGENQYLQSKDLLKATQDSQRKLKANLIGQILAFTKGHSEKQDLNKNFEGNRPVSLLWAKQLTPYTMGALLAHYENKVMFQGFLWNLNSFDQEGVQLGKALTQKILNNKEREETLRTLEDLVFT